MKKRAMILIAISFCADALDAQTFEEWFKQKKTQIKYLVQQIEALNVYTDYLQEGYEIASEGLKIISNIKHEDFFLHKGHFDSLKIVKPFIKESSRITEIILLGRKIVSTSQTELANAMQSGSLIPEEVAYLSKVYNNILNESSNDLAEVVLITKDDGLEMKDDERIKRIESIYLSIQDKYAFVKAFTKQAQILSIQRMKDRNQTDMIRRFYNIR
jgi:hypothetical protein